MTAPPSPTPLGQRPSEEDTIVGWELPAGPMFRNVIRRRRARTATFVAELAGRDRVVVAALTVGWVASFVLFWVWWLQPAHHVGWAGLVLNSLILLPATSASGYFFFAASRLRRVNPALPAPPVRVAFVVTRAPSERWAIARGTLTAMLAQRCGVPYDVWLCDEDPDEEVLRWCEANGVRVSCRRGLEEYHRLDWPRRTRCKEGNLAYFYDQWGYRDYDVVAQLDCDHVPHPTYLAEMVRPFADPAIGYVAAPSICDANAAGSWAARGRLHREAVWHGATQTGHNGGLAPLCIGSHYAVRTRALRQIGGLGPELAEDLSTTFLLVSAGWQGAFALDAEAHGDGPFTFADMLTQEFQWSRSVGTLLYDLVPHHLRRLRWGVRLRFLHHLSFYPLLALVMTVGLALPPIALFTGRGWMEVDYLDFLAHIALLAEWPLALGLLMRRRGLARPRSVPLVSWEGTLFAVTRWPYVVLGLLAATLQYMWPRAITFKVTPKERSGLEALPARLIVPHAAIAAVLAVSAIVGQVRTTMTGYVFLCLLGAVCFAAAAVTVPILHIVESARAAGVRITRAVSTARTPLLIGLATLVPLAVAIAPFPGYLLRTFQW